MPRILSENEKSEIIDDYLKTKDSGKAIGERHKCADTTVIRILKNANVYENRNPITPIEILMDITERYKNGEMMNKLAKEYGIGEAKLKADLKRAGLYFRKYKQHTENEIQQWISDLNNGLTPKEISKKYKVMDSTIINHLLKAGVYIKVNNRWTNDEIHILKKYYPNRDWGNLYELLPDRTKQDIYSKASELKISTTDYFWTEDEIDILKNNYDKLSLSELSKLLPNHPSTKAISSKATKIGIAEKNLWTDEEKEFIFNNYSKMCVKDMLHYLPNRTYDAIVGFASVHKLKGYFVETQSYTEEQLQFIKDNYNIMTDSEIADVIGKTPVGVAEKRRQLGIYFMNKDYSGYEDLSKLFRGHLSEWKSKSIEKCNYACIITNDKSFQIHHIIGFNIILKEVYSILDDMGLLKSNKISDYSKEELDKLLEIFSDIHSKYPLGVCLKKDIHELFHNIYGSGGNTEEQFNVFIENYKNGKYNELVA